MTIFERINTKKSLISAGSYESGSSINDNPGQNVVCECNYNYNNNDNNDLIYIAPFH